MPNLHQFLLNPKRRLGPDGRRKLQRGQAMVLIAMTFIGLAAFVGLTVDAGILFIQIGHLRRAVDSASLAAANQFREGRTLAEIEAAAEEFINLNSLNPANAHIFICDWTNPTPGNPEVRHDINLCPPDTNGDGTYDDSPPRKFVRVEATMPVDFAFLPIVGWGSIDIHAGAVSEAASVDIVLAIDTSQSMAYDAACGDWDAVDNPDDDDDAWAEINIVPPGLGYADGVDDCDVGGTVAKQGGFSDDYFRDPDNCNDPDSAAGIQGECQPFEDVRDAALQLVNRLYFPYDRIAIVTFDLNAVVQQPFTLDTTDMLDNAVTTIGGLTVFKLTGDCGWSTGDPTNCTNTNIADGLLVGGAEFYTGLRQEAVPIFILLSDGAANAATDDSTPPIRICPGGPADQPTWIEPFCHDKDFEEGVGEFGMDTEDWAVDRALYVGCPEANSYDPAETSCSEPGQGAVIFTIGLGEELINDTKCAPYYSGSCQPNQGEELLRYIAGIGDDGDPSSANDCDSAGIGESCGNYYFSPTGSGLMAVFEAIASRIFTRIVH